MTIKVFADADSATKSVMEAWVARLKDIGVRRTIPQKIGSTDNLSFIAVDVPGFIHRSQRSISAKYAAA